MAENRQQPKKNQIKLANTQAFFFANRGEHLSEPTCLQVTRTLEVANEEVARYDDGGVAQQVEEEAEQPDIVPAFQQRQLFSSSIRREKQQHNCQPKPADRQTEFKDVKEDELQTFELNIIPCVRVAL